MYKEHKWGMEMKKRINITLLVLILILVFVAFIGCGANQKATSTSETVAYDSAPSESVKDDFGEMNYEESVENKKSSAYNENDAESGDGLSSMPYQDIMGDRKIIFNAFITLEVDNFNESLSNIKFLVEGSGSGYIQSSSVRSRKVSSKSDEYIKEGTIILRVAQNKYNSVLDEIKTLGNVIRSDSNGEEITDRYYDTKYRTEMYEAERERIMTYLKDAKDLETMLILERKLSEVTYEIERLKGSLRHMDNLVDFSTITIELSEKEPGGIDYDSFLYRVQQAFKRSIIGIINAFGDLIIGLINIIPVLVVIFILYLIGKPIVRKMLEKRNVTK
jgi:hypothetical protein